MPWFRVDDGLANHPKVLGIPRRDRAAAMGLWALAGAWSAANLQDGFVPAYLPDHLGCPQRLAGVLVSAGLWLAEPRGWRFYAWAERQPSREQVEAERLAAKERQQRWRERKKGDRSPVEPGPDAGRPLADGRSTSGRGSAEGRPRVGREDVDNQSGAEFLRVEVSNPRSGLVSEDESRRYERGDDTVTNATVTLPLPFPSLPDPTRPLPLEKNNPTDYVSGEAPKRRRATRLPDDFPVTNELRSWAAREAPNAGPRDHDDFCDYWHAKAGKDATKLDWPATWKRWMRKASDERGGPASPRGTRPGQGPKPGPDQRAAEVADLAARIQAQRDAQQPPPPIGA